MLNKQILEIETGKLLVKNPSETWLGLGGYYLFCCCCFLLFFSFLLAFVFAVAVVAVVCLFVYPS